MTNRREFIHGAMATGLVLMAPRTARAAEARIEVLADEPIGVISPNIYGHFVEHLGGVVYDGIWVGESSKVPNVNGVRQALVEHMRRIRPGVVRWPGGCFADSYNWRDGIGPRGKRPRRTNFWRDDRGNESSEAYRSLESGPQKYEPNWFGSSEFMALCRQTGAAPYFAANMRSLPANDFQEWVEYCNAPAGHTTLSDLRATSGDREPYKVEFWGVGNESWGCGGRMTPEEYSQEYQAQSTTGNLWGLQGSASLGGKQLTLTVVNPHATEAREAEVVVRGAAIQSGQALALTAGDIHAHNSFDFPHALEPASVRVDVQGGRLVHRFSAASVTRLQLVLA